MDIEEIKENVQLVYAGKTIKYGEELTKDFTSVKPIINFEKKQRKLYSIIMVDPDAPSRENPTKKYNIHLLIINNNDTIVSYKGPGPPENSGPHRYYTCVFEQESLIYMNKNIPRERFNLINFVKENNLKIIGCFKYIVVG